MYPSHDLPRFSRQDRSSTYIPRLQSPSELSGNATRLLKAEQCPKLTSDSETCYHMLSSKVPSSIPLHLYGLLSRRTDGKQNINIHRILLFNCYRAIPQSRCCSGPRHPKCHCSWNTVKCFCSCCCPLKILAASMTAVKISQALPLTCQQGLKIVWVANAGQTAWLT